ncbi:hypothetical protein D7Z94_01020 [Ulvibacterium marinum]|uniref:Uncharacterized protein n=1 Tax=Ulvibacterium marinum TaxID=2419782 RepID=A0A3B0C8N2_9FLAO|nr:hypothetical protein D7Z94_01020 [Ulvibacterium marinum]
MTIMVFTDIVVVFIMIGLIFISFVDYFLEKWVLLMIFFLFIIFSLYFPFSNLFTFKEISKRGTSSSMPSYLFFFMMR